MISGEREIQQKNLYTFRQNHSFGITNHRLDYIFISNKLQKFPNDTDIILAFKTDHSSVLVAISNYIYIYIFSFLNQAQAIGNSITH